MRASGTAAKMFHFSFTVALLSLLPYFPFLSFFLFLSSLFSFFSFFFFLFSFFAAPRQSAARGESPPLPPPRYATGRNIRGTIEIRVDTAKGAEVRVTDDSDRDGQWPSGRTQRAGVWFLFSAEGGRSLSALRTLNYRAVLPCWCCVWLVTMALHMHCGQYTICGETVKPEGGQQCIFDYFWLKSWGQWKLGGRVAPEGC